MAAVATARARARAPAAAAAPVPAGVAARGPAGARARARRGRHDVRPNRWAQYAADHYPAPAAAAPAAGDDDIKMT